MLQCLDSGAADYLLKPLCQDVIKTLFLVLTPFQRGCTPHFVRLTRHHFFLLFVLRISTATTLVKTPSTPPFQITLAIYPNQLKFQAIKCGLRYKIVWRRLLLKRLGKVGRLAEHLPTIIFCTHRFASRLSEMMIQHYTPGQSLMDASLLTMTR